MEEKYSAHNYHPLPVVYARAKDVNVWDPEGHHYLDFLSAYSAVNQAHKCTLSSRAFHNDKLPQFARMLSQLFGYDMMLPMNTGAEGVETALKLARKWGYQRKGIPQDEALIISCCGCFHGRTMAAISMSCDNDATRGFSPLVAGNLKVDFGDADALAKLLQEHGPRVAGFIFEPIQGEAGRVRELCTQHNVLMIADEIQTGIARTGRMLACDWEGVRPDAVVGRRSFSWSLTFGGNPLGCAVAMASLESPPGVLLLPEDPLVEPSAGGALCSARAAALGEEFRQHLSRVQQKFPRMIKEVRGRGLLNAVEMDPSGLEGGVTAYDVCIGLKERGILAKPTHNTIIRLAPPLTMSSQNLKDAAQALHDVLEFDMAGLMRRAARRPPPPPPPTCDRCGRVQHSAGGSAMVALLTRNAAALSRRWGAVSRPPPLATPGIVSLATSEEEESGEQWAALA
eukprot:jgi/Mesen1/2118/ME001515S01330